MHLSRKLMFLKMTPNRVELFASPVCWYRITFLEANMDGVGFVEVNMGLSFVSLSVYLHSRKLVNNHYIYSSPGEYYC